MKILLVEDDPASLEILKQHLMAQHYTLDAVSDGEQAWAFGMTFGYDLIILDVMLPSLDGLTLCRRFRAAGYQMPILLLTAQDSSAAKVYGLDSGADDYVVKPFDMSELMARIRALLRRGLTRTGPLLTWGDLSLNPSTCEVTYGQKLLTLTTKEYELLELLLRYNQQVLSNSEILDRLWPSEAFPSEATVRSHIRRLRQKLTTMGAPPDWIATIHGRGYYLKPVSTSAESAAVAPAPVAGRVAQSAPPLSTLSPNRPETLTEAAPTQAAPTGEAEGMMKVQYLALLNQTWQTARPQALQQVLDLGQCLQNIAPLVYSTSLDDRATHSQDADPAPLLELPIQPNSPQQALAQETLAQETLAQQARSARTLAHGLAGKLGIFGLWQAGQRARQIEAGLHNDSGFRPGQIEQLQDWATQIEQQIQTTVILTELSVVPTIEPSYQPSHQLSYQPPHLTHGQNPKVLLVDDDVTWLHSLSPLLESLGFNISTLADPSQFWAVLHSIQPDALVLDVNLSPFNGIDLCDLLRQDSRWQRLPVMVVSAATRPEVLTRAFAVGADDYICKPICGVTLGMRIRNRLQRLQAYNGLAQGLHGV